nr:pinin like 1 [Quercus suber]
MNSPVKALESESKRSPSPNGLKRRQSSPEREDDGKRQRWDPDREDTKLDKSMNDQDMRRSTSMSESKPVSDESTNTRQPRRGGMRAEEKQRGKRLFGALLGNLNQPSDRVAKRRQEIENRRKAELQRQDDEQLEEKQRRLARLAEQRRKTADQERMRARHHAMLDAASSLQTQAEPPLYYRPWDLRPDEEDRIADQLKETRAQIDHELQSIRAEDDAPSAATKVSEEPSPMFEHKVPASDEGATHQDVVMKSASTDDAEETTKEAQAKSAENAHSEPDGAANNEFHAENTNAKSPSPEVNSHQDSAVEADVKQSEPIAVDVHADDDGDHIVEGDEDTVIY